MSTPFRCSVCEISFASWKGLKKHLLTREHKIRSNVGNVDSIMDKFVKSFKRGK